MLFSFILVPQMISERFLIPNTIKEKHKFFNKVLDELFEASFDLMPLDSFIRYVIDQWESRWRMECQLKNIQLYEEKFNDSTDGHWQNVRKYSQSNDVKLTAKDLKPAEGSV